MRTADFKDYKFRCHAIGKLMGGVTVGLTANQEKIFNDLHYRMTHPEAKPLTAKQQVTYADLLAKKNATPKLSVVAKSYLKELHKQELFGMNKEIQSKYLDKGIQVEEQAITLYSEVTGKLFLKNKERKENKYWTGECDNSQGKIRDIKSSWDFETFPLHEMDLPSAMYDWQMQAYMDLWGHNTAEVIYCLVDTPDMLIEDEKRRTSWKMGLIELPDEVANEIEYNMRYSHLPKELRVKIFYVKKDLEKIRLMRHMVKEGRKYLNQLSERVADILIKEAA